MLFRSEPTGPRPPKASGPRAHSDRGFRAGRAAHTWSRRPAARTALAALIVVSVAAGCAGSDTGGVRTLPMTTTALPTPAVQQPCTVTVKLEPTCGAWFGAAAGIRTPQRPDRALYAFERTIGRKADIMHTFHRDAELFPTYWEIAAAREPKRPRLLLVNWKPEMGRSWAKVAAGDPVVDRQIDLLASHLRRNFDQRFFLTIHHEPEDEVKPRPGSGYTAADYRAMYRHVVQRLRKRGARKVVTVMTYMGWAHWGVKPWFQDLYPGHDVVDWIAYDPFVWGKASDFAALVNPPNAKYPQWPGFYNWATKFAPDKPIMMAEWGIFERPKERGHKPWFFWKVGDEIDDFPRLKALVYFDSPNTVGGDSRVNSNSASLEAFRDLSRLRYFNINKVPRR